MRHVGRKTLNRNDDCWCGNGRKYKNCHLRLEEQAKASGDKYLLQAYLHRNPDPIRAGEISELRSVPDAIPRPDYAGGKRIRKPDIIKNPDAIQRMRAACRAAREILEITKAAARVGVTTDELDRIAHEEYIKRGGYPSPLGYHGYPKSICTSLNEVICHGIPDSRPLQSGDTLNIDVTIFLDGMHGDLSEMVLIGDVDPEHERLARVTRECLDAGIAQVKPGGRLASVGHAIETHAHEAGFSVVDAFVGHGIGELFHMEPQVPHYYNPSASFVFKPGMTFTIEPMINQGTHKHFLWDDEWTAVTRDFQRSAQWEHTVLVTEVGVEILTLP